METERDNVGRLRATPAILPVQCPVPSNCYDSVCVQQCERHWSLHRANCARSVHESDEKSTASLLTTIYPREAERYENILPVVLSEAALLLRHRAFC